MPVLGRLLQVLGWLWLIGAVVSSILDFGSFNIFPGILLLIIARIFRAAGQREAPQQANDGTGTTTSPQPTVQSPPPPADNLARPTQKPTPAPEPTPAPAERPELLERIARAGQEVAEEGEELLERVVVSGRKAENRPVYPTGSRDSDDQTRPLLSSEEMIAQARKRWDRPKR